MASTGPEDRPTSFEIFDGASKLLLRLSLQAFPVFVTIAAAQYIARHL